MKQTFHAGTTILGPFALPVGTQSIGLRTAIDNWPTVDTGVVATVRFDASFDGGASWVQVAEFKYSGGLNPRTRQPPPGPHPVTRPHAPFPPGTTARAVLTLAQAMTGTATFESS